EPSRNGAHGKVEPTVDHLGGGKAIFLVVPPAPERDGTDAELRPQLRAGNEIAPLEIRSLPRVFLPSQYPNFALSHVPPRNGLTVRERSSRTEAQRHQKTTEFAPQSATGKFQAVRHRPGSRVKRLLDLAADRRPHCRVNSMRVIRERPEFRHSSLTITLRHIDAHSGRRGQSSVSIQEAGHALSDLGMDELVDNVMNTPVE